MVPSGVEALALDANFDTLVPLEQVQGDAAQVCEGMPPGNSRKVASHFRLVRPNNATSVQLSAPQITAITAMTMMSDRLSGKREASPTRGGIYQANRKRPPRPPNGRDLRKKMRWPWAFTD